MLFEQHQSFRSEYETPTERRNKADNETPGLWAVNDKQFETPTYERFRQTQDQLYEATVEGYGHGVFESIPERALGGMKKFVQDFLKFMGYPEIPEFSVDNQVSCFLNYLDYYDLYFIFYDTAVQLSSDNGRMTYTEKLSGSTLDPERMEIFKVQEGWKFWPYQRYMDLIRTPEIQAFAKGARPFNKKEGRPITRSDVLAVLAEPVIGSYNYFEGHISETLQWIFEEQQFAAESVEACADWGDIWGFALESTMATTIACAAYLKSPMAIKLLSYYHPVYYEVLDWDEDQNHPVIRPGTEGECVVSGIQVYTLKTLVKHESTPPGTCRKCSDTLHCTKYVDANALIWKVCSCGDYLDPADVTRSRHMSPSCQIAYKEHPPIASFVCFRCAESHVKYANPADIPPQLKCSRGMCPNTQCQHHLGDAFRKHELNQRRRLLLTQS